MKRIMFLHIISIVLLFSCATVPDVPTDVITYRQSDGKPIKRIPKIEGNFEIIQGSEIQQPINMKVFEEAALQELNEHGYTTEKIEEGAIMVRLTRSAYWVQFKICYWTDEHWFEYVDSKNLDVTANRKKIHRSYYRWIANLDKWIIGTYYPKVRPEGL